ncbi:Hsp70 family protein [Amycolatopsis acidicola]|uniref:Hsp70 family protein n=1 Tax=Amycolatopsis acidicola TaxID=2596893 RepID=A0A5N0USJ3_9PSEU|nr:Hsp70 family protein [Amycolatopsis acidicola]KAA9152416.1 Hsp70 family protein [Amycolatopsis acidicola]
MNVLGIDFGTSSTVAVLSAFGRGPRAIEIDGSVTMSSAVFANEDGTLVVGQDAERRARLDPARFEPNPKRRIDEATLLLGDNVVQVTDALAAVLRRVGEEATRQLSGQRPDQVRISHPARWGSARQGVLRQAAIKAGFGPSAILVPEPVAAAAHYASVSSGPVAPGSALAVYDLGAGTFDCAVVGVGNRGFTVLADNGLPDLGSLDIDQALLVHIGRQVSHADPGQWQRMLRPKTLADRRMRRALLQDVRDAKETLSRHAHTEIPMPEPFRDVLVTRAELEALVRPNLLRSAELLAATIRDAGLAPRRLTGVYLVGGPSRMPLVAKLLADQLGVIPTTQDQPETAVAFGLHENWGSAPTPNGLPEARTVPAMPPATPRVAWQPQQAPYSPRPPVQLAAQPRKRRKKPMLIGAGALVLVGVLATVLVLALNNSGPDSGTAAPAPTTGAMRQAGSGGCDQQPDSDGLTNCWRQLAGSVPDRAQCHSGLSGLEVPSMGATVASCTFDSGKSTAGQAVVYYQGLPFEQLENVVKSQLGSADQLIAGTWSGNGLSGKFDAGVGSLGGFLVYGTDELSAMYLSIELGDSTQTSNDLVDFFQRNLKPGV